MQANTPSPMSIRLHQYSPRWDLPSFDPFCLSAQTYLRLLEVPFEEVSANNPDVSPTSNLPFLQRGEDCVAGTTSIFSYLSKEVGKSLDNFLSPEQKATAYAFTQLIETKLHPTLLYNWWTEKKEVGQTLAMPHFNTATFPLGYVLPRLKQRQIRSYLYTLGMTQDDKVYSISEECYETLSQFLAEKPFFFGDNPSGLDAVVFGHLAIHLVAPQSHKLRSLLLRHQNLEAFCKRMAVLSLKHDFPTIPALPDPEEKNQPQSPSQPTSPHTKMALFLGLLVLVHYLTKQNQ
jgi:glutathione S-transferase